MEISAKINCESLNFFQRIHIPGELLEYVQTLNETYLREKKGVLLGNYTAFTTKNTNSHLAVSLHSDLSQFVRLNWEKSCEYLTIKTVFFH